MELYIAVLSDEVLQSWLIKYGEVKNNKEREGELIVKRIYGKPIARRGVFSPIYYGCLGTQSYQGRKMFTRLFLPQWQKLEIFTSLPPELDQNTESDFWNCA